MRNLRFFLFIILIRKSYAGFGNLAGNEKEGKIPQVVFINYFDMFPTEPYPYKVDGATIEIPPDQRYLLPPYMTLLTYIVLGTLSGLILLHLLRRRPIDHFEGHDKPIHDKTAEAEIAMMSKDRKSDHSRLFFYKKRTNHVATSQKLQSTFERDFDPTINRLTDEEYALKAGVVLETAKLGGATLDDDEGL
ncbi:unnamed protein product [Caenorhabditis nigoni]